MQKSAKAAISQFPMQQVLPGWTVPADWQQISSDIPVGMLPEAVQEV